MHAPLHPDAELVQRDGWAGGRRKWGAKGADGAREGTATYTRQKEVGLRASAARPALSGASVLAADLVPGCKVHRALVHLPQVVTSARHPSLRPQDLESGGIERLEINRGVLEMPEEGPKLSGLPAQGNGASTGGVHEWF